MLNFKPAFSLSSFTLIKMLFSSSLLFAIRVVSSAYLRLLIFLPAILIPAYVSSSPAFLMMYSASKLNSRVTIYSLDVLLFLFGTSLLFHFQFYYPAIKRNTFESVLMRWMKLEPIIQSEISQKEKHQYNILMHIYRI